MGVHLRTKKLSNGGKTFYLDIYRDGVREYEFLGIKINPSDSTKDKNEKTTLAKTIRAKREIEVNSEEYEVVPKHKKKADFMQFFLAYIQNSKGKGVRKFKATLLRFDDYLKYSKDKSSSKPFDERKWESFPVKRLSKKVCQGYYDYLKHESGLTGETPYDYFKRFRTVVNSAIDERMLLKNPLKGIQIKREGNNLKKEILEREELQKLTETYCGNTEVKRAFLFACFTGLGEAELRKLTWRRIQNDRLRIFREKNGEPIYNLLPPFALKILGERGASNDLIFTLPSSAAIGKNIRNWVKNAQIDKKISFYCARHTFAVQLLENGANLKTVADCLGHTSTKHTLKYLNYTNKLKDKAITDLPSLDI